MPCRSTHVGDLRSRNRAGADVVFSGASQPQKRERRCSLTAPSTVKRGSQSVISEAPSLCFPLPARYTLKTCVPWAVVAATFGHSLSGLRSRREEEALQRRRDGVGFRVGCSLVSGKFKWTNLLGISWEAWRTIGFWIYSHIALGGLGPRAPRKFRSSLWTRLAVFVAASSHSAPKTTELASEGSGL